jgi:pimeloyl-ACP methyl ester carboxylesterase
MRLVQRLALQYIRTKFKLLSSISKRKAAEQAFQLFCSPQSRTKSKLSPFFEGSEKIQFEFHGETVRGYRWNHPSKKKALILHGFESSVVNFEQYIEGLIKKGYEVCAFDGPAHGYSSGKTLTLIMYKDLVHYLYKNYGPFNAFIAHSFGGLTLSLVLEEIPHDSSMKVVMIAPATETKTALDNFFKFLQLDPMMRPEFESIIKEMGGKHYDWFSITRAASNINAQVLFLQDKDDLQTPYSDVLPLMKKNLPNFRFVISEGLGHSKIYREKKTLNTVMEFL